MIAFIQVRDTAWSAFLALDSDTLRTQCESCEKLRRTGALNSGAPPGYWDGTVGFVAVNCIGSEFELDAFYNYFPPSDTLGYWKWNQNGTVDFASEYTGQHDDILFLHRDHVEYDQNGNVTGTRPATFDDPNWANDYFGSDQNKFARAFSRGFAGGLG